ncbi:hypothetical protein RFI_11144, partial [Reticulomyxa filosa]
MEELQSKVEQMMKMLNDLDEKSHDMDDFVQKLQRLQSQNERDMVDETEEWAAPWQIQMSKLQPILQELQVNAVRMTQKPSEKLKQMQAKLEQLFAFGTRVHAHVQQCRLRPLFQLAYERSWDALVERHQDVANFVESLRNYEKHLFYGFNVNDIHFDKIDNLLTYFVFDDFYVQRSFLRHFENFLKPNDFVYRRPSSASLRCYCVHCSCHDRPRLCNCNCPRHHHHHHHHHHHRCCYVPSCHSWNISCKK